MATRLDHMATHRGVPFTAGKGEELFPFDIPSNEEYKEAWLEVVDGRYNAGARIVSQPASGETGSGKVIKVEWWFDGGQDLSAPPFINYRVEALTTPPISRAPAISRAIVVAIENTGQIPFALNISDTMRKVVERFVDTITEVIAEAQARKLFTDYYQEVAILDDTNCTKERIRDTIAELGKDHVLDLAILGHGGPVDNDQVVLILHGGVDNWWANPINLREADVRAWKDHWDFQGLKLGLVYMMNCYGSRFNDTWCDLGFKTAIGSHEINWMPEPMFTFFWTRFRAGASAQDAAQNAWEDSKRYWQAIHRPTCKPVLIPDPPYMHLDCKDNARLTESRPVITGESTRVFTDEA